jgi:N-acetylneuraminate synthase/N,N'-diacetyllegionaminate synthase
LIKPIEFAHGSIGPGYRCFIIAEAGVNHNGDLKMALELVNAAHKAGVDAIKFQLFRANEQVSQTASTADYQLAATKSRTMLEMAKSYDLPWEAHHIIAKHCSEIGIVYLASCFDRQAVDFFLEIGGECIKVGSGEITNYPLLEYMTKTGKPILLSTGMSTLQDVAGAVELIWKKGHSPLALFQCTSNYPADPDTINLRAMKTLEQAFQVPVGYSDHTIGIEIPLAAVALGANLLEKHFTLDRKLPGPDHAMSIEPDDLKDLVEKIRSVESALGDGVKKAQQEEISTQRVARRSLVTISAIKAGETLSEFNVTLKRPGTGIDPRLWEYIQGRKAKVEIPADIPITWEMIV